MFRIKMSLIALIGTPALGACGVQGVSQYQTALHLGGTPSLALFARADDAGTVKSQRKHRRLYDGDDLAFALITRCWID